MTRCVILKTLESYRESTNGFWSLRCSGFHLRELRLGQIAIRRFSTWLTTHSSLWTMM
jgi:hypothetical protein